MYVSKEIPSPYVKLKLLIVSFIKRLSFLLHILNRGHSAPFVQGEGQESMPEQNFFFDERTLAAGRKRKQQQEGGARPPLSKRPPVPRGPCWFCLGGEQVEKHLVVSVGDHVSYVHVLGKGLIRDLAV